jgi:hypothetical protein
MTTSTHHYASKNEDILHLAELERKIPDLKGKKREMAMKIYRELLKLFLEDEPIYLLRYE